MNLTTQKISQQFLDINKLKSFALPLGILVLIVMMVIPLPSYLLDVFTSNILLSLLILMVALHTFRPLDFSEFSYCFIIRNYIKIRLKWHQQNSFKSRSTGPEAAGKVIEAFGSFVIALHYVVGIFVFLFNN